MELRCPNTQDKYGNGAPTTEYMCPKKVHVS